MSSNFLEKWSQEKFNTSFVYVHFTLFQQKRIYFCNVSFESLGAPHTKLLPGLLPSEPAQQVSVQDKFGVTKITEVLALKH